ncbi:MAG: hypothetical protein FWD84_06500, partial [Oscillospiraceae bacterium]|nr:hypothetical protein [Oscillospiraceae bacterium]
MDEHVSQEELGSMNPVFQWNYARLIAERMVFYIEKMPRNAYFALYGFGSGGLRQILSFRRTAGTDADNLEWNIAPNMVSATNIPLYNRLYEAIEKLQNYMNPSCRVQNCITNCEDQDHIARVALGDIVVLLATQTPDVSESSSSISLERLRARSRDFFIPITFESFNIDPKDMSAYAQLTRKTGGMTGRAIVPNNPERITIIDDVVWRGFMSTPYNSLGPWDGYMAYITDGSFGNFMGSSTILPDSISIDLESHAVWLPSAADGEEPPISPMRLRTIRPYSISSSLLYLDSFLKSFFVEIIVRNPYSHELEIVLIDPSGNEHPVEIIWGLVGRSGQAIARIDLNLSAPGLWRIVCRGVRHDEAYIHYVVVGVSRGLYADDGDDEEPDGRASASNLPASRPYKGAIFSHIDVVNVRGGVYDRSNGGELFVTVRTQEGRYPLTDLRVLVDVQFPDGRRSSILMSDDGNWPDAVERDGVFTGVLNVGNIPEGQVILTARVSNPDGTATPTYFMNNTRRIGDFDLDGESPFWGEPITERFYRRAQIAFDVIGDLPAERVPLPRFETVTLPLVNLGQISGLRHLIPGIEVEYTADIAPGEMLEPLAEYLSWAGSSGLIITPDPQGRVNVVRVRVDDLIG